MAAQKCTTSSHYVISTALNDIVCHYLNGEERNASISGNIYDTLIRTYGKMDAYDDAVRIFEMIQSANAQCLSSMLYVCSVVSPARWEDAIFLLHTSDIVPGASNRGRIDYSALSYAVIACAKENEWEVRNRI